MWFAVDPLTPAQVKQLIEERLAPDADHTPKLVPATAGQISREIDDVLRSVPKDSNGNVRAADVGKADWDSDKHSFGPGTADLVKQALKDSGGEKSSPIRTCVEQN